MCHTSLLPSSQNPKRRMNTEQIRKTKSSEEKDQHLCKQALSESRTDLLRSCGCGWDSWEGDCPNTNGLWTREEEGGGWAACSNTEEEGAAERKGPDWMEFSMALNRSPANMETEDGEKLQLMLWFEVFPKGGGGRIIQSLISISHLVISHNVTAVWNGRSYFEPSGSQEFVNFFSVSTMWED